MFKNIIAKILYMLMVFSIIMGMTIYANEQEYEQNITPHIICCDDPSDD